LSLCAAGLPIKAYAGSTGIVSGIITRSDNGVPVSGAAAAATAPTATYHTTTDPKGFYSI
jgi:hypothetical protein